MQCGGVKDVYLLREMQEIDFDTVSSLDVNYMSYSTDIMMKTPKVTSRQPTAVCMEGRDSPSSWEVAALDATWMAFTQGTTRDTGR